MNRQRLRELRLEAGRLASCVHEVKRAQEASQSGGKRTGLATWKGALYRAARAYAKAELRALGDRYTKPTHGQTMAVLLACGFAPHEFEEYADGAA